MGTDLIARMRTALVVFAVLVFFTSLDQYTEQFGFIPLYWVALLGAGCALPMGLALLSRPIHISPIVWWMAGFLVISSLWYYRSEQTAINFQAVQTRYLSAIFIVLLLFLLSDDRDRQIARKAVVVAAMIGVTLNIYELFNPLTFSDIRGRSTGLYSNVNQSGAALVLAAIIGFGAMRPRWRPLYLLVVLAGIMPTFSRGAILGWVLSVGALYLMHGVRGKDIARLMLVPLLIVGFVFSPLWSDLAHSLEQRGALTTDVKERLNFFNPGTEAEIQDDSAREREVLAALGWQRFSMKPWIGWGTGASYLPPFFLPPHNIYLSLMVDHGALGILIYPALLIMLLIGVNRESGKLAVPLVLFLAFWGLFSHNVLEERFLLLAIVLGAATVDALRRRPSPEPDIASLARARTRSLA